MTDEAASAGADRAPLKTLADKVNWVLDKAHPAGRGRFSDAEVCFKIHAVTGEQISTTTIWKLRNGQLTNPQLRVIEALARTFGIPAGFFLDDYDEEKLGLWREQVELLALIRDAGITAAEFRAILGMDAEGRKAIAGLIERVAHGDTQGPGRDQGAAPEAS
jgi:transcriptional regulator with XRE-family HTH domain